MVDRPHSIEHPQNRWRNLCSSLRFLSYIFLDPHGSLLLGESSVFMALPNCFELFGFDFLVDEAFNCYLLGMFSHNLSKALSDSVQRPTLVQI